MHWREKIILNVNHLFVDERLYIYTLRLSTRDLQDGRILILTDEYRVLKFYRGMATSIEEGF